MCHVGSPLRFLCVSGGSTADYESIAACGGVDVPQLVSLIPDSQLCMPAQYTSASMHANQSSALYRIRSFPAAKLSRYAVSRAYKFLLVEVRPFVDVPLGQDQRVGISWIEVFGEPASEDEAAVQAALVRSASGSQADSQPTIDLSLWRKDVDGDATMVTPRGLAAFKPTGEAERLLQAEQKNQPPKQPPPPRGLTAEQQAKPILNRNASFLNDLRQAGPAGAASAPSSSSTVGAAKAPPACPLHPAAMMVQRVDRKMDPPRTFFVCLNKSATGQTCDTKVYAEA